MRILEPNFHYGLTESCSNSNIAIQKNLVKSDFIKGNPKI